MKGLHGISFILVIVGGLNWGLQGLGYFMGSNWNVVNMLLGGWPMVEAIVYVLVGVAAAMKLFGCKCAKCSSCTCSPEEKTGGQM